MNASQSLESVPSQAPTVPPENCEGRRWVGDLTHRKLEPVPHWSAERPLML